MLAVHITTPMTPSHAPSMPPKPTMSHTHSHAPQTPVVTTSTMRGLSHRQLKPYELDDEDARYDHLYTTHSRRTTLAYRVVVARRMANIAYHRISSN